MEQSEVSFYNEISLMMFGFGDSHKPNPETVRFVENIVITQMRLLIREALKYSNESSFLKGEELVFLLRHNKYKMRRLVRYFKNKHFKNKVISNNFDGLESTEIKQHKNDPILEFIEKIDETGEFMDLSAFDEVKYERQLRADRIAQALDQKKYFDFCKARCASFSNKDTIYKNMDKIKIWLYPKSKDEIKFSDTALEMICYYAYQTVAELIDYALLVRMDAKCGTDPLKHLHGSYYTATMFTGKHRFEEPNPDYSKVLINQPPLTVSEIKEVMRRVHTPQAGKLNFGGKLPDTHFLFAL